MRIWSVHPKYLDGKGLVALWRETLLAKNVLENKTKGYKNHPQLIRFKETSDPLSFINKYLEEIYNESQRRNYSFDKTKVRQNLKPISTVFVTNGQMEFEIQHLKRKLKLRDPQKINEIKLVKKFEPHSLFTIIEGEIESWEKF
ncbi:MAG TPA: pyrimidine dimer DNA glycosylase/endonuclease V [Chitinophagaceae bacterium]